MTRPQPTFASNAVITVGTQATVMAVGLLASVLISRALGAEGRGEYYVPVTAVTVTFAVVHLSVEMASRYFHAERLIELAQLSRVSATAALWLGGLGVLILATPYLAGVEEIEGVDTAYVALAALALPFTIHGTLMMNLFVLGGRLPRAQAATVAAALLQTAALVGLWLADGFSVTRVLVVYIGAAATSWALLLLWSRAFAPSFPTADVALVRRVVGHGVKIHLGFVAYFVLLRVDVFFVQAELGSSEVGRYSLAVLFAEMIGMVTGAIAVAGLPFQSVEDRSAGAAATFRTVRTSLMVAGALAGVAVATLWWVLPALYGEQFAGSYGPMVALLPGVVAMTTVRPMWNWLVRDGRPGPITLLLVGGLALNVVLNLLLLPLLGLYGASVASSVAYALLAIVLARWTIRSAGGSPRDLVPDRADLHAVVRTLRGLLARRPGVGAAGARDGGAERATGAADEETTTEPHA